MWEEVVAEVLTGAQVRRQVVKVVRYGTVCLCVACVAGKVAAMREEFVAEVLKGAQVRRQAVSSARYGA
jgi:hypothetical protein